MNEIQIDARELLELVTGANVGAANKREIAPQHFTGVNITVSAGTIRAAGTNGAKLAIGELSLGVHFALAEFEFTLTPDGVKSLTAWLKNWIKEYGRKNSNPLPITLNNSSVNYCGEILELELFSSRFPDVLSVIPSEFTPSSDTAPAQGFNAAILADLAKIPNTNKNSQVNLRVNHAMRASLASWVNDSGVFWRYVFMPLPADRIKDNA